MANHVTMSLAPAVNSSLPLASGCDTHEYLDYICSDPTTASGYNISVNCTSLDFPMESGRIDLVCHGEIWTPDVIQRIVTMAIIMPLTLFGNVIIITVLSCSKYRKLHSRVNLFIINLAIGDLTVCFFTMTTEVLFVMFEGAWMLGAVTCKVLLYIQIVTLASTTFILTAMSVDRFTAICRPLSFGASTRSHARRMIMAAWFLAFLFASPQLGIFKQEPTGVYPDGEIKYNCASRGYTAWWQRQLYFTFMAAYILVIPSGVISYCYINVVRVVFNQGKEIAGKDGIALRKSVKDSKAIPKAKIKTVKMTLSIICSFIMCWTPYFVVHLIHIWSKYKYHIPQPVYVMAENMALLNSALNPILYGCFNIKLKRGLMEVFCPQNIKDQRRTTSMVTECVSMVDNHSRQSSRRPSPRGLHAAPSTISGSHLVRQVVEKPPPGEDSYKLKVRFVNDSLSPSPDRALLSDYYDKENR